MRYEELVEQVRAEAGFAESAQAERAVLGSVRALGERLVPDEAAALAAALPEPLAAELRRARYERDFHIEELYDRVARREGAERGFGLEHVQAVLRTIGGALPEALRIRLQKHLGGGFAPLFEDRPRSPAPPRPVHTTPAVEAGAGTTLATGKAGSRHPLSTSRLDRAQAHSVVREQNPHGETKLSSGAGLTQERRGETLASGKPGPEHPVSETKR